MRRLAALIVMAVLLAACGSTDAQESAEVQAAAEPSTTADAGSAGAATSGAASEPSDGPFDAVPAVGGGQIDGTELAGRDLALWFWAPW
jgi:opacity protein-like surface antigen